MVFKEKKGSLEEQKISLTVEYVKDALGPHCTDFMAEEILRQKNPREKISEIKKAFEDIEKSVAYCNVFPSYALSHREVGVLLVQHTHAFVRIAESMSRWRHLAMLALITRNVAEITRATNVWLGEAYGALGNPQVGALFRRNPEAFAIIANAAREGTVSAFYAFANLKIAGVELYGVRTESAQYVSESLQREFIKNPEKTIYCLMLRIIPLSEVSIEIGRPLDDFHEMEVERDEYLNSLSALQVIGLLMSNPEFFYTSTNHMLFDRLKKDLGGKSFVDAWIRKNGLFDSEQVRNIIFRAMNYDRLAGGNGIFSHGDMDLVKKTLLGPILHGKKFDLVYYYLLANNLDEIKRFGLEDDLRRYISKAKNADAKTKKAHEFLLNALDGKADETKSYFSPDLYRGSDGKLNILQIFDKEDVGREHWGLSQKWFSKYGKPTVGKSGELIYETKNARITLFMGESEWKNQEFVRAKVREDPNMIIAFRGHSFSLNDSFPYDIFGNSDGHILFIPGSCGSAGSVPEYLNANPQTDLRHFSNTSTGRGQVTNAIIDALIESDEMRFDDILRKNSGKIMANGGDVATIKVWGRGEQLISYVNKP